MTEDPPTSTTQVARQLLAIASPIRLELLETLRLGGVLSSSQLAKRVPEARGGIQATMNDMAAAGWVRHEEGSGRNATWSVVDLAVTWSDVPEDEAVKVARAAVEQAARQRRFSYVRAFESEWENEQWPREWADASVSRDYLELLTPDELEELEGDLHAAVVSIRERATLRRSEGAVDPRERPVFLTMMAFPRRPK